MKKKKFQSALLDPPGRYTVNNFLFKGGLRRWSRRGVVGMGVGDLVIFTWTGRRGGGGR